MDRKKRLIYHSNCCWSVHFMRERREREKEKEK